MNIPLKTSIFPSCRINVYSLGDLVSEIAEDVVFQNSFTEIYKRIIFRSVEECQIVYAMEICIVLEERYGFDLKIMYPKNFPFNPEMIALPLLPCEAGWHWPEAAIKYVWTTAEDVCIALDNSEQQAKTSIWVANDFVAKFFHEYRVYSIIEWNDWWVKGDDDCVKFVDQAIAENPKSVADYKNGKENAIKHIMGQAMRLSKGKISPNVAIEMLKQRLS